MPAKAYTIQRLTRQHECGDFDCGAGDLNVFLRKYARQNARKGISQTFVSVLPNDRRVLGYYSLSCGSVSFENLPKDAPGNLPAYPVPVAHLGRLAVDRQWQGRGLGEHLLLDALARSANVANEMGVHAVEVRALDEDARAFYLKYQFTSLVDDKLHLYLPMKLIRKLLLTS